MALDRERRRCREDGHAQPVARYRAAPHAIVTHDRNYQLATISEAGESHRAVGVDDGDLVDGFDPERTVFGATTLRRKQPLAVSGYEICTNIGQHVG